MSTPVDQPTIARSYAELALYIDGAWVAPAEGASYAVVNPATEEVLGHAPQAGVADAEAAIEAAATAFRTWKHRPASERSALLRAIAAEMRKRQAHIATLITLEMGKPFAQAMGEVEASAGQFEWFAEEASRTYGQIVPPRGPGSLTQVSYEPVGVVAAFTPWNFPVSMLARKLATALAAGCTVVARPAEEAPAAVAEFIRCIAAAGVPKGVVNLLLGVPEPVASVLLASKKVRKLTFTGSVAVGKRLFAGAADTLKHLSLELGGHAPVIVFDREKATQIGRLAAARKFANAGQVCVSPTRFFVQQDAIADFTTSFVEVAQKLKLGAGIEPTTEVGPLATRRRLDWIERLVEETRAAGGKLLTGGRRPEKFNRGYFFEPTVFTEVADDWRILSEEIFGPVAPIVSFRDEAEAIERANNSSVGLSGYVFTSDFSQAQRLMRDLELGMIGVNTLVLGRRETPFGGTKESGLGREGGAFGIYEFLEPKWCEIAYDAAPPSGPAG
jgi:succinate-semialdehyde dehydrogenase/glutarate-semialdehyde dehydrogenase